MRVLLQELAYLVVKYGIPLEKGEQLQVVRHIPRVAHHDDPTEGLRGRNPVVVAGEGAERAVRDVDVQGDDTEPDVGQLGQGGEAAQLYSHDGRLDELPAHRGFGEDEREALGRVIERGLAVKALGDGLGVVTGKDAEAGSCILGRLE